MSLCYYVLNSQYVLMLLCLKLTKCSYVTLSLNPKSVSYVTMSLKLCLSFIFALLLVSFVNIRTFFCLFIIFVLLCNKKLNHRVKA